MTGAAKFLLDPYLDWVKREGPPIHEGPIVNAMVASTAPWARLGPGCSGAFIHLDGRGDFLSLDLIEIAAGAQSAPQRHIHDAVFYVLSGRGEAIVDIDGHRQVVAWGPRDLFAPPLNAPHGIVNQSREEPARLIRAHDLRLLMNIYHSEGFIFGNPLMFPGRGAGESNAVPDLGAIALTPSSPGPARMELSPAGGSLGVIVVEIGVGDRLTTRPSTAPAQIIVIAGVGRSSIGDSDVSLAWEPGACFVVAPGCFHHHTNMGAEPARFLSIGFGTRRRPLISESGPAFDARDAWIDRDRDVGHSIDMSAKQNFDLPP